MEKIVIGIILIILLISPSSLHASQEAGSSASISPSDYQTSIDVYVKKSIQRKVIVEVLEKYHAPLSSEVDGFLRACDEYQIDCYLLPSIAGLESSFGKHTYPNSHNPFGWGGGMIMFDSWEDGFMAVAKGLRERYIDKGADTIEKIAPIYAESQTWAQRVQFFHNKFTDAEKEKIAYFQELALNNK